MFKVNKSKLHCEVLHSHLPAQYRKDTLAKINDSGLAIKCQ